ncbi:MAG: hypothetical protein PHE96_13230, partial [Methylococcales bacterium]|nr:hypothetical protein [Methylococcales bacterium]
MFKKIKQFMDCSKDNERGIAILFTLGILSLLLIMAMSFATDAIIERKAAYNNNTRTQAKLLAQSALNRAIASMRYYVDDTTTFFHSYEFSSIYSNGTDTDQISTSLLTLSGDKSADSFSADAIANTAWHYITDPSTSKLIGRYAYAAFADSGRVDAAAAVDSGITAAVVEDMTTKTRPGVDVNEMYFGAASSDLTVGQELTKLSCTTAGGVLANGQRWVAPEQILSSFLLAGYSSGINATKRANLYHLFNIYNPPDIEAYWVDANSNDKKEIDSSGTYEMYHRFNLARTDWDSVGVWNDDGSHGPAAVAKLRSATTNPEKFSLTYSGNSGIQYLNQICNVTGVPPISGTFASIDDRRNQIAANIIDYCDNNSIPTSNLDPASWGATKPLYTGNEKTYYINELNVKVSATVVVGVVAGPTYNITVTPCCYVGGEIVDIYGLGTGSNYSLSIYGKCEIYQNGVYVPACDIDFSATPLVLDSLISNKFTNSSISYAESISSDPGTAWMPSPSTVTTSLVAPVAASSFTVEAKVTIYSAVLNDGTNNVDFVYVNKVTQTPTYTQIYANPVVPASASPISTPLFFAAQTEDPRQNLNDGDWTAVTAAGYSAGSDCTYISLNGTFGTAGANNNISGVSVNPSSPNGMAAGSFDPESVSHADYTGNTLSTGHISTAYIRNAPMLSPWELGVIHRGAKWETINLKKFNSAISYVYGAATTGSYAAGDAGVLDQVKMNDLTRVYGKVDLNLQNNDVLKALFYNLPILGDNISGYADPGSLSVNLLLNTGYATLYNSLTKDYSSGNEILIANYGHRFKHRAEIANALGTIITADATMTAKTDAQQEAIIGKII